VVKDKNAPWKNEFEIILAGTLCGRKAGLEELPRFIMKDAVGARAPGQAGTALESPQKPRKNLEGTLRGRKDAPARLLGKLIMKRAPLRPDPKPGVPGEEGPFGAAVRETSVQKDKRIFPAKVL